MKFLNSIPKKSITGGSRFVYCILPMYGSSAYYLLPHPPKSMYARVNKASLLADEKKLIHPSIPMQYTVQI